MTTLIIGIALIGLLIALVILGMQIAYAHVPAAILGIYVIRDRLGLAVQMLELTHSRLRSSTACWPRSRSAQRSSRCRSARRCRSRASSSPTPPPCARGGWSRDG